MKMLLPVAVGILGFLILYWVDFFDLKKRKIFKILTWLVGLILIFISHIQVIIDSKTFLFPEFLRLGGIVSSIIFFTLLLYSVFIEIPLLRKKGFAINNEGLIGIGTYALSRHPGVLWYILMLVSLFLSTGSKLLLVSIPLWGLMDVLYAFLQDRIFFPRLFGDAYYEYRKSTPILLPTIHSIRKSLVSYKAIFSINNEKPA